MNRYHTQPDLPRTTTVKLAKDIKDYTNPFGNISTVADQMEYTKNNRLYLWATEEDYLAYYNKAREVEESKIVPDLDRWLMFCATTLNNLTLTNVSLTPEEITDNTPPKDYVLKDLIDMAKDYTDNKKVAIGATILKEYILLMNDDLEQIRKTWFLSENASPYNQADWDKLFNVAKSHDLSGTGVEDIQWKRYRRLFLKSEVQDNNTKLWTYTWRSVAEVYQIIEGIGLAIVSYLHSNFDTTILDAIKKRSPNTLIPTSPIPQELSKEELLNLIKDNTDVIIDFDFTGKTQADVYEEFKTYTTGTIFKLKQGIKLDVSNSEAGVEEWDLPANQTAEVVFNTNNHLILRVEAITGIAKETRIIYITGKGIDGNVSTPSSKILFSEEQFNRNDIFTLDNDAVEADEFKKLSKAISSGYGVFELERGNVIFTFTRYEIGGTGISLYTSLKDDGSSQKLTLTNNVADKVSGIDMVSIPLSVELDNLSDDLKTKLDLLSDIKKHQNVYVGQWKKDTGISNLKSVNEIMSETNPFTYSTGAQSDIFQLNFNTALLKGLPGGVWNLDILLISSGTDNFYINNINSGTPVQVVSNQVRRWKDTIKATIGKGDGGWLFNDLDFANPMRVNFKIINNGDHVHIKKTADRYQEIPTNRLSTSFLTEAYYHFDGTSVLYTEDINKRVFDYSIELEIRNRYGRVSNMKEIFVIFTREVSE